MGTYLNPGNSGFTGISSAISYDRKAPAGQRKHSCIIEKVTAQNENNDLNGAKADAAEWERT